MAKKFLIHGLSLVQLRSANVLRCNQSFHPVLDWSPSDWMMAVTGEVGEAANLLKKGRHGDGYKLLEIAYELADVVTYTDLLAARLGISLSDAVAVKFNIVSARKGSSVTLPAPPSLNFPAWAEAEFASHVPSPEEGASRHLLTHKQNEAGKGPHGPEGPVTMFDIAATLRTDNKRVADKLFDEWYHKHGQNAGTTIQLVRAAFEAGGNADWEDTET